MKVFVRGLILSAIAFGFLWGCSSSKRWSFPHKIDGYSLSRLITGGKALAQVNGLHGKPIQALKGSIALYEGEGKEAMVWVSLAPSSQMALQQVGIMVEKMEERGPFHDFSTGKVGCILVHRFLGLGQEHYLFSHGASVFWISAPVGEGKPFVKVFARRECPPLSLDHSQRPEAGYQSGYTCPMYHLYHVGDILVGHGHFLYQSSLAGCSGVYTVFVYLFLDGLTP